ncbi:hypothetical protein DC3_42190 [Deinococcus cellulosilyticus NBRC 106333 = KACC 11606]|uniref:Glucodextranase-like C-terminal domain-containing protein n=1 Tax=Deinococcus cellulosilyticus (strain DSM 18568 / NBRC 106333 / KACC 11606 / 5516J-15) TaxID=1223518 RepID=A0A511N6V9_DEIC1|nr:hypothetical protein DC3_42190 [Deinococcus cellulosilyticus NBRC 106333 = KACC 11606]
MGDGTYHLPENLSATDRNSLDLRSFVASDEDGKLSLDIGLGGLSNPLDAPLGFSTPILDIFIKTRVGGSTTLGDTGFETPPGQGWQYHLHLSGFNKEFYRVPRLTPEKLNPEDIKVSTSGTTIKVQTPIPAGQYEYWVTVSLFDPLTPAGLVTPVNDNNPYHLTSRLNNPPAPVDVLAQGDQSRSYIQRTLPPVGDLQDFRPWILLIMGTLGMVGVVISTIVLMNRRAKQDSKQNFEYKANLD